jgi:hypothetical protein
VNKQPFKSGELDWLNAEIIKTANQSGSPIRVGLMIDAHELLRPFAQIVEQLNKTPWVQLSLVIRRDSSEHTINRPLWLRTLRLVRHLFLSRLRNTILFRLFQNIDSWINSESSSLDLVSIESFVKNVPELLVKPLTKGYSDWFEQVDVEKIKAKELDVILRFGFRILKGEILNSSRHGIWSFHHGDNEFYRGAPPCFWEMVEGNPTLGVIFQRLNNSLDNGNILERGYFSNQKSSSLIRNRIDPYWSSSHFVLAALRTLLPSNRVDGTRLCDSVTVCYKGARSPYKTPNNLEFLGWLSANLKSKLAARLARKFRVSHWRIGVAFRKPQETVSAKKSVDLGSFRWLESPRDKFWADPFLIDHENKTYLFFEEYDYKARLGTIACCELFDDLSLGPVTTVLSRAFHLSFPHVFSHNGRFYMLPEGAANSELVLYEATEFPLKWEPVKVLLPIACVDSIIFYFEDRWWLQTALQSGAGPASIALLFYASDLFGDWTLHPQSPIFTDYRYARNAGPIHKTPDGELFRVSQSSEVSYGSSFSFHKIKELNPKRYREELTFRVLPDRALGMRGTHSYTESQNFVAVDGVWNENELNKY